MTYIYVRASSLANHFMRIIIPVVFVVCYFVYGCSNPDRVVVKDVAIEEVEEDSVNEPPPPPPVLKVAAYLLYKDNTASKFDVLNDKSKALWNTIIGEGDAEKPSEKIKLVITGTVDSIHLMVKNGKKLVLDKKNLVLAGNMEFVIRDTGCEDVAVTIFRNTKTLLKDTIAMRCGE